MNRVKFGDVVQEIKINVDRSTDDHEYFIAGEHMDSCNIHITRRGRFSESDVGPAFIRLFRPGQVLYGSRRTYLRKVAVADFEGITSNTTFVLETKDSNRLLQELLPYIMLTDRFSEYAVNNSKGSTNPYILFKDLAAYEFDLPTIEEQRQLVVLLSACDRAKEAYKRLLKQTDEVVKSQFIELFGGPESVSGSGVTISDVADVQVGIVIKPTRYYAEGANGIKAFRSLNIGPMSIKDDDWVYFTEEAMKETQRTVAHAGDVLVVRSGNPGTSCVVPPEYDGCNVVDLIIAHPKTSKILPEYLCAFTNMPHGKNQIDSQQRGVAQKHFNVGMYNDLKLILPSIEEQRQFVSFLKQSDKSKFVVEQLLNTFHHIQLTVKED